MYEYVFKPYPPAKEWPIEHIVKPEKKDEAINASIKLLTGQLEERDLLAATEDTDWYPYLDWMQESGLLEDLIDSFFEWCIEVLVDALDDEDLESPAELARWLDKNRDKVSAEQISRCLYPRRRYHDEMSPIWIQDEDGVLYMHNFLIW